MARRRRRGPARWRSGRRRGRASSRSFRSCRSGSRSTATPCRSAKSSRLRPGRPRPACDRSGGTAPRSARQAPMAPRSACAPGMRTEAGPNASKWMSSRRHAPFGQAPGPGSPSSPAVRRRRTGAGRAAVSAAADRRPRGRHAGSRGPQRRSGPGGCRPRAAGSADATRRKFFEHSLERMLAAIAHAVEQMDRAFGLLGQAPAQHAHHRRDADAAGNQHRRHGRIGIDEEVPRGRLHLEDIALVARGRESGSMTARAAASGRPAGGGTRLMVTR